MRINWIVACRRPLVDQNTSSISLIDVVDQFDFTGQNDLPDEVIPVEYSVVAQFSRDNGADEQTIHLEVYAGEEKKGDTSLQVDLQNYETHNMITGVGLVFRKASEMRFVYKSGPPQSRVLGELRIPVKAP